MEFSIPKKGMKQGGSSLEEESQRVHEGKALIRGLAEEDVQALTKKALTGRKLPLEDPSRVRILKNAQSFESPFSEEIEKADPPRRFSMPKLRVYNGTLDPVDHVQRFQHSMALWVANEPLMCKVFPSSLGDLALKWFSRLKPRSICNFLELAGSFVMRFVTNSKQPKDIEALLSLYNEVEGNNEQVAVATFKLGLPRESQLRQSLTKRSPATQEELMNQIKEFIKLEKDLTVPEQRWARSVDDVFRRKRKREAGEDRRMGHTEPTRLAYEGVLTIFRDPIYKILIEIKDKPYFKRPPKMVSDLGRRNPNLWCSCHRENDHLTENCKMLKQHLEDLVKEGHLKEFITNDHARKGSDDPSLKGERSMGKDKGPIGIIDVVHGITNMAEVTTQSIRTQRKMAAHLKEVYHMTTEPSFVHKMGERKGEISFSDEDLRDVVQPHNEPLVLTVRLQEYDVRRILIDPGSSSEIMYMELFDKLVLNESDLKPTSTPLFRFSWQAVHPKGIVTAQVGVGHVHLDVKFLVVDVPSPYNAIVGCTWIHRMRAVPSIYHQCIRFPTSKGVMEIRGDQVASRSYLVTAIKGKAKKQGLEIETSEEEFGKK